MHIINTLEWKICFSASSGSISCEQLITWPWSILAGLGLGCMSKTAYKVWRWARKLPCP